MYALEIRVCSCLIQQFLAAAKGGWFCQEKNISFFVFLHFNLQESGMTRGTYHKYPANLKLSTPGKTW